MHPLILELVAKEQARDIQARTIERRRPAPLAMPRPSRRCRKDFASGATVAGTSQPDRHRWRIFLVDWLSTARR